MVNSRDIGGGPRYSRPVIGRMRWALTGYADAIAIVPFYITLGSGIDLRFVRALRLLRRRRDWDSRLGHRTQRSLA